MRIAVDEINAFLLHNDMQINLVVFGTKATILGERIYPDLEAFIDHNYVDEKREEEYGDAHFGSVSEEDYGYDAYAKLRRETDRRLFRTDRVSGAKNAMAVQPADMSFDSLDVEVLQYKLGERMKHMSDTFSEYLMYLIESKGKSAVEVYTRAIVDKKVFSKIKNNPDHHPNKLTAMCLCVGAELNMDETRDLLARAGYALSPCDKTDVIFSYFIEHQIYDMIELDIQLEEHGLKCIIS